MAAVVGFVFGCLSFCFIGFLLVAMPLAIVGLGKTSSRQTPALKGRALVLATFAFVPVQMFLTVVLAAIAIPSFMKFQARSKASEARVNVKAIYVGVLADHADKSEWPGSVPMTPSVIPCGKTAVAAPDELAAWRQIGWAPEGPSRYAYAYTRTPDGSGFLIEARGDLNCNGVTSSFKMGADGTLQVENETE